MTANGDAAAVAGGAEAQASAASGSARAVAMAASSSASERCPRSAVAYELSASSAATSSSRVDGRAVARVAEEYAAMAELMALGWCGGGGGHVDPVACMRPVEVYVDEASCPAAGA